MYVSGEIGMKLTKESEERIAKELASKDNQTKVVEEKKEKATKK